MTARRRTLPPGEPLAHGLIDLNLHVSARAAGELSSALRARSVIHLLEQQRRRDDDEPYYRLVFPAQHRRDVDRLYFQVARLMTSSSLLGVDPDVPTTAPQLERTTHTPTEGNPDRRTQ